MPNTINATNPMPTNSATSATGSYSSQCRLPESMIVSSLLQMDCENRSAVAHPKLRRMGLLLARLLSENQAKILELLNRKKF